MLTCLLLVTVSANSAESLLISGSVEAKKSQVFSVPAANSWRLQIKWMAEEGTKVKAGETVVMYDTASLSSDVEQREADVRKAEAEAKRSNLKLTLNIKEAEFRLEKAELELEKARLEAAIPEQQLSKVDYETNQLDLKKAENEFVSAKEALKSKRAEVINERKKNSLIIQGAKKELQRSQSMLANMEQKASDGGTVQYVDHPWLGTKIRSGDTIQRGFNVLKIPSTDDLHVRGWLNEIDIARVKTGQPVKLNVDAIPGLSIDGVIEKISNQAESRSDWGESSYFALNISINSSDVSELIPGMSVLVEVLMP